MNRKKLEAGQYSLPLGSRNWEIEPLKKQGQLPKKIQSSTYQTNTFLVSSFFKPISLYSRSKNDI